MLNNLSGNKESNQSSISGGLPQTNGSNGVATPSLCGAANANTPLGGGVDLAAAANSLFKIES